MELQVGTHVLMKKPHPCGCNEFVLTRVGMDIKLKCCQCDHEVMLPRKKAEKNIKQVVPQETPD